MKSVAEHLEEFRAAVRGYPELTEANRTLLESCFISGFVAAIRSLEVKQDALIDECQELSDRMFKRTVAK